VEEWLVADSLILEVADLEVDVLTGIYSEETGRAQPLRITITVEMKPAARYDADTPLVASKNYMDLKFAATEALPDGVHFKLIEAVADHICDTLFVQDVRVEAVTVKIVKLAIAENGEQIGMTLRRERR
jgi:7,8-dihydroneopterin aldolase/epimerase/oxygenase